MTRSPAIPRSLRRAWPLLLLLAAGCAQLPPRPAAPVESALAVGSGTELDRRIAPEEQRHPGQSAFRLVSEGPEAFAVRAHAARIAGRSVDVQTYIWHGDLPEIRGQRDDRIDALELSGHDRRILPVPHAVIMHPAQRNRKPRAIADEANGYQTRRPRSGTTTRLKR